MGKGKTHKRILVPPATTHWVFTQGGTGLFFLYSLGFPCLVLTSQERGERVPLWLQFFPITWLARNTRKWRTDEPFEGLLWCPARDTRRELVSF